MKRSSMAALSALALGLAAALGVLSASTQGEAFTEVQPHASPVEHMIPAYPGAPLWSLGGPLHVDGVPRQLAYALADDSPSKIAAHYAGVWKAQGLEVDEQRVGEQAWVTARAATEPYLRTVAALPQNGRTLLLASVSTVMGTAPKLAELPAGCQRVSTSGADDADVATEIVLARCAEDPQQLMHSMEMSLGKPRMRDGSDNGVLWASWSNNAREVMLAAAPTAGSPATKSTITLTWQRRH